MALRIGIVGAGENTRLQHIPGFQGIEDVEVVAVCNRTEASGEKVAEELSGEDTWKSDTGDIMKKTKF